jgi:hypothetical protein
MGRRETATHLFSSICRAVKHNNKNGYVIDALGHFGPQTVSSLRKNIRNESLRYYEKNMTSEHLESTMKRRKALAYECILDNTEIRRVIEDLKTEGLVKELPKEKGAVFGLTFKGLIDYLRNDGPELDVLKVKHLINLFENPVGGIPPKRSSKYKRFIATKDFFKELFPILSKEDIARFLSKYASIECYFVGMFIYNLLWNKRALDEQPLE